MDTFYKNLPNSGPAREALRVRGQFWTPDWIAEAMVAYVIAGGSNTIFDPAVGNGAFFRAAKTIAHETAQPLTLLGTEVDPLVLHTAQQHGLEESDLSHVQMTDFVHHPPDGPFKAIVANPPYIRHHRLSMQEKARLKTIATNTIGTSLDGRAGLHIYFLLTALRLLAHDGRLAFLMPADTCEGVFAPTLWQWITTHYRLEAVITFAPEASPFPKVDTNPLIFLIRSTPRNEQFLWAHCMTSHTPQLKTWLQSEPLSVVCNEPEPHVSVTRRNLTEALETGLSRHPQTRQTHRFRLLDFARVLRGVATGSNEFFFLTSAQVAKLNIPPEFLRPAIGRTRDVPTNSITAETLQQLDQKGRPTLLFSPDGRAIEQFPSSVQDYLNSAQEQGIQRKPLLSTRRPWYKMETRTIPPFLFAYLGRRSSRFIRNEARVIPLTVFLCIYPYQDDQEFTEKLWKVLQHPETIANLRLVGKSYGSGAIKVEPRSLEQLPLPEHVVQTAFGPATISSKQQALPLSPPPTASPPAEKPPPPDQYSDQPTPPAE